MQPGEYNPTALDGKRTEGIEPPKSNWGLTLDEPPYMGYAVTGGLFYNNYPGGSGLMAGAVFGRIAGVQAAGYAVR